MAYLDPTTGFARSTPPWEHGGSIAAGTAAPSFGPPNTQADDGSFSRQFEEVERSIENLMKAGKMMFRREANGVMAARPYGADADPRLFSGQAYMAQPGVLPDGRRLEFGTSAQTPPVDMPGMGFAMPDAKNDKPGTNGSEYRAAPGMLANEIKGPSSVASSSSGNSNSAGTDAKPAQQAKAGPKISPIGTRPPAASSQAGPATGPWSQGTPLASAAAASDSWAAGIWATSAGKGAKPSVFTPGLTTNVWS